jgi:hypothetical protein
VLAPRRASIILRGTREHARTGTSEDRLSYHREPLKIDQPIERKGTKLFSFRANALRVTGEHQQPFFVSAGSMNRPDVPSATLAEIATSLSSESAIVARISSSTIDEDLIALVDTEWPRVCPFAIDTTVNMLAEPWLDDPDLYPDITLSVKRNLCSAIRCASSIAAVAKIIYQHWPFSNDREPAKQRGS